MKPHPRVEAMRWLVQARSDLAFAEMGEREGFYAQACFMCQQAGEKALKALHYLGGARLVTGHSLVELLGGLAARYPDLVALKESAQVLDQHYVPTRYPNGLPAGSPSEVFTKGQAADALGRARRLVDAAAALVG